MVIAGNQFYELSSTATLDERHGRKCKIDYDYAKTNIPLVQNFKFRQCVIKSIPPGVVRGVIQMLVDFALFLKILFQHRKLNCIFE